MSPITCLRPAAIGLGLLGLIGCAASPAPERPGRGFREAREGGPRGAAPSLFISPAGKPFRAAPGEPYPVGVWFAQADRSGDGRLDLAEFEADAAAFFKVLDQNGDGVVAGPEVTFYEERLVPEILSGRTGMLEGRPQLLLAQYGGGGGGGGGRRGGGGGGGGGKPSGDGAPRGAGPQSPQGAAPYSLLGEPEPVTAADSDFNSLITAKEFKDAADRRFKLLDTAEMGYLTLATLPKMPVQTGAGRGPRRRPV
ncbi:MAG TPA: hypothetical protein VL358_15220 [Caulobacteraceae bacterium]|jgi:hypothetical protein|nr:hypothetical protein [Caulobacteraceae bacterium]